MQKISKVVTGELTMIVKNRKKCDLDEVANRIIQADIADKVDIHNALLPRTLFNQYFSTLFIYLFLDCDLDSDDS